MIVHHIVMVSALLFFGPASALAQQQPVYTKVFESDSLELTSAAISPNGKWVVFVARPIAQSKRFLMIVPATGGQPRPLTSDGYSDTHPIWFPSGDRIVFRSSRVNDALMTLRVDPITGTARGNPQRLTLQTVQPFGFATSPDGKSVFFTTQYENRPESPELMVLPASGGNARLLARMPKGRVLAWWTHPDSIVFAHFPAPSSAPSSTTIWSISSRGGSPKLLRTNNDADGFTVLGPGFLVRGARLRMAGDTLGLLSLTSLRGDTLVRLDSRKSRVLGGLNVRLRPSADGRSLMLAANVGRSVTRVLSIDGGVPRDIRAPQEGSAEEYPYGFTPDSRSVWVQVDAQSHMAVAPVDGGESRVVPLPAGVLWPNPAPSGRWLYAVDGHAVDTLHTLRIIDVATGRAELISRAAGEITAAGNVGDDRYYWESRNGALEVRRWTPGKGSTLVQIIPPGRFYQRFLTGAKLGPEGRFYAFVKFAGDTARIFVGDSSGTRQVLAVRGMARTFDVSNAGRVLGVVTREPVGTANDSVGVAYVITLDERARMVGSPRVVARTATGGNFTWPIFSPDGSLMALGVEHANQKEPQVGVLLMSVNDRTGEVGAPRRIEIPRPASEWNDISWTGDGKYLLLPTYASATNRAMLWRIPARGDEPPVNISEQDRNLFWEVLSSPDGKWVTYQADLPERNTIWRIDLPSTFSTSRK